MGQVSKSEKLLKLLKMHPYCFIHSFKKHPLISKNFGYNVTEKRLIIQWSFIQGLAEQNPKALLKRLRTANGARGNAVQSIWSKKKFGDPFFGLNNRPFFNPDITKVSSSCEVRLLKMH